MDASDHTSTAENIRCRKIQWKRARVAGTKSNADFGHQWDRLVSLCCDLVTRDSSLLSPHTDLSNDAEKAWSQFFKPVFEKSYTSEQQFSKELLQALKWALGDMVDNAGVPGLNRDLSFKLRNQRVGSCLVNTHTSTAYPREIMCAITAALYTVKTKRHPLPRPSLI